MPMCYQQRWCPEEGVSQSSGQLIRLVEAQTVGREKAARHAFLAACPSAVVIEGAACQHWTDGHADKLQFLSRQVSPGDWGTSDAVDKKKADVTDMSQRSIDRQEARLRPRGRSRRRRPAR